MLLNRSHSLALAICALVAGGALVARLTEPLGVAE